VALSTSKPESPAVSRLEGELGLTPAAMLRLRVVVEPAEDVGDGDEPDHYAHLRAVAS
jgi:phage terminase small subunit